MIIDKASVCEQEGGGVDLSELKEALVDHICTENKAFFKSQQINEEELTFDERKAIVKNLLNDSHTRFLSRFGMNMKKEHLKFFELSIDNSERDEERRKTIEEQIKNLAYNLDHRKILVKNRRYAAMVKLISEKQYFSESEMRQRDPLLFDQLIGQYMTGEEKRAKRRPDPKTSTLLDVLFEGIDYERDRAVEKEQRRTEEQDFLNNEDSQAASTSADNDEEDDEAVNEQQWGNFEDSQPLNDQEPASSSSTTRPKKRSAHLITAGERDVLREEFLGIMYNRFLSGGDTEFFDYSTVDANEEYDDAMEKDQDCEDKYFDEEESQDTIPQQREERMESSEEDELDTYMRHLHRCQKAEEFQEEFDDD